MAKENKTRDDINSNDTLNSDNQTGATTGHENTGKMKKLLRLCNFYLKSSSFVY
jgi:hypothetical protein